MSPARSPKATRTPKGGERPDYVLFDKNTKAIVFGYQQNAIQRMLDFDYVCKKEEPSVSIIVNPTRSGMHKCFWGTKEILLPMVKTLIEATKAFPEADVMVNFASFRSAYETTREALESKTIRTVAVIAEGIPERRARHLAKIAKDRNKWIIGPATVGGIAGGAFKIGNTAGMLDNIIASRLHRPGSVAYVSKSGGMSNELNNIIARNSDGVYEGVAIGGDRYPGSTFIEHIKRYEKNPEVKMMVLLGEVGGADEYAIVDALKKKKIKKPLVAWCIGTCSKMFSAEVQFGHAGARAGADRENSDAKNKALREAGAVVPHSFEDFDKYIKRTFDKLVKSKKIKPMPDVEPPRIPIDYKVAMRDGIIRRPTEFISTISSDKGDELRYCGVKITDIFKEDYGLGGVIGLLWLKKKLPAWAAKFIEMVVLLTADHGPAVSGAHNAIVAARAGKDIVSAVASGILTIGPRFGGAVNGAAKHFTSYKNAGHDPAFMVKDMKKKNVNIQGIGHRIKSVTNPDQRVTLLKEYAKKNFPMTEYLDYALEVEKITTSKRNNLILNVDGCVGILCCDMFRSLGYSREEATDFVDLEVLNAFFLLGRSIGIMGHVMDQKRLHTRMYRHPWDDIAYMMPDKPEVVKTKKKEIKKA
ncbi:MAG: citrate/2-methylcitrate synthase [Chloroflexota bacterium]|nr:citrate/2-methylcitrate synthase [Chloroflexota bacterium]